MEAAALAHGSYPARTHVVHIMEEHLVPAVPAAQKEGHGGVHPRPCAVRVRGQRLIPPMGVVEVCDEGPSRREAKATETRHHRHEEPAFTERLAHAQRSKQPHSTPETNQKCHMLHTRWEPLGVEGLVALAACARIGKLAPPEDGEEATGVAGTDP